MRLFDGKDREHRPGALSNIGFGPQTILSPISTIWELDYLNRRMIECV